MAVLSASRRLWTTRFRAAPEDVIDQVNRVGQVYSVIAVCYLAGCARDFSLVEAAADELAIAGQIFDDFLDIDEDLGRGRLNYAARFILGSPARAGAKPEDAVTLIAQRLIYSDRAARLFDEVIGHVEAARHALAPLKLPEAGKYFSDYVRSLETTAAALGAERARRGSPAPP